MNLYRVRRMGTMEKYVINLLMLAAVGVGCAFVAGCESKAQTGALIGAAAGAGIGQLAGRSTEATLIGGAVGGGAGYIIGNEAEKKSTRQESDAAVVNMTNSNGSVSQVKLKKYGMGYVGPKGEYYEQLPTGEQLRPIYGF